MAFKSWIFLAVLGAALIAIPMTHAQEMLNNASDLGLNETSSNSTGPVNIDVGIYVLNVGKFDISSGSYTVDFYMDFKCDRPCNPDRFEFMNGRATSFDKLIDDPQEKFYRIQAALSNNIDLKSYPFDHHALNVQIEDKVQTKDQLVYNIDYNNSGIDPSVVIVGWQLDGWNASIQDHYYGPYNETYSRINFDLDISRVVTTSIIKSFLPVIFMVVVALLSLLIMADKVTTRLTLNTSTLIAAVLFHVNLTSSIPPTGYLTFADKFMIATYLVLIAALFSSVLLMRHTDLKDETRAKRIYRGALVSIPIFTVIIYGILFLLV